jgi:hypothetical protein
VVIRGFRFRTDGGVTGKRYIAMTGELTGSLLDNLDLQGTGTEDAINVTMPNVSGTRPWVIRECKISDIFDAIEIAGASGHGSESLPGTVVIHNNRITNAMRGITCRQAFADVNMWGNLVSNCQAACIQFEDLGEASKRIFLANNSLFKGDALLRIWDNEPYEQLRRGQVDLRSNVLVGGSEGDILYVRNQKGNAGVIPGDPDLPASAWNWQSNWRDFKGSLSVGMVSMASRDKLWDKPEFLSRDPASPDFLRPAADSPLATGGAGNDDPSLPLYVGAVPPKGTPAWDWDRTWRWRMRNRPSTAESKAGP